jgi:hypothetical protein
MLEIQSNSASLDLQANQPLLSPFLQLINIRRILASIHRSFYTSIPARSLSLQEKLNIRRNLMNELEEWKRNIPNLGLSSSQETAPILSSFSYQSWYEALYHSAVLLMFRPSGTFPHEGPQIVNGDEDILRITWESSRAVIRKYKEVLQARRLNYSWICLYTIFMAGLANVYSVGRSAQRWKLDQRSFLPDCAEVMTDVQDCSNILTAICERWDDARSSCEIFSRLSSSAFKELLKVYCPNGSTGNRAFNQQPSYLDHPMRPHVDNSPTHCHAVGDLPPGAYPQRERDLQLASPVTAIDRDETLCENLDFQNFFQGMQSSLAGSYYDGPNEVVMGLDRSWFT